MCLYASIVERNTPFFAPMKRQNSKTFSILYNWECRKIVKADRPLMLLFHLPRCIKCYRWGMRSYRWTCTNSKSEKASRLSSFSDYVDIFSKSIFFYFSQRAARVDVAFDRYIGAQSIKSQTRVKRGLRAKKPIRKILSNGLVPLPRVWAQFCSLSKNKADLAAFWSEDFVKRFPNVPAGCELVLGGGFVCTEKSFIIQP